MGRPANDQPDIRMLELATPEMTTPTLVLDSSSSSNDIGLKSNGPLTTTVQTHDEYSSTRTSRESVLRRLSDALMRHSLAEVRMKIDPSARFHRRRSSSSGCDTHLFPRLRSEPFFLRLAFAVPSHPVLSFRHVL